MVCLVILLLYWCNVYVFGVCVFCWETNYMLCQCMCVCVCVVCVSLETAKPVHLYIREKSEKKVGVFFVVVLWGERGVYCSNCGVPLLLFFCPEKKCINSTTTTRIVVCFGYELYGVDGDGQKKDPIALHNNSFTFCICVLEAGVFCDNWRIVGLAVVLGFFELFGCLCLFLSNCYFWLI